MKEGILLGVYESTLRVIVNQEFENPQHQELIEQIYVKAALELLEIGKTEEMKKLRVEMSKISSDKLRFMPKVVDIFPAAKSTVGSIMGPDKSPYPVERDLLGREYIAAVNGIVVFKEYYKPQGGQDDPLFMVAEKYEGISGLEGVVTKKVPRLQAEGLLFTGCDNTGRAQAAMAVEKKELVEVA